MRYYHLNEVNKNLLDSFTLSGTEIDVPYLFVAKHW